MARDRRIVVTPRHRQYVAVHNSGAQVNQPTSASLRTRLHDRSRGPDDARRRTGHQIDNGVSVSDGTAERCGVFSVGAAKVYGGAESTQTRHVAIASDNGLNTDSPVENKRFDQALTDEATRADDS